MWSQFTNVTDRQTDRRTDRQTTCDRNTALCTKVHRAVKTINVNYTHWLCKVFCFLLNVKRLRNRKVIVRPYSTAVQWPNGPVYRPLTQVMVRSINVNFYHTLDIRQALDISLLLQRSRMHNTEFLKHAVKTICDDLNWEQYCRWDTGCATLHKFMK